MERIVHFTKNGSDVITPKLAKGDSIRRWILSNIWRRRTNTNMLKVSIRCLKKTLFSILCINILFKVYCFCETISLKR
jgi:hypothetical protein